MPSTTRRAALEAVPAALIKRLGADHVEWILSLPEPSRECERRAMGAWHANLLDLQAAYIRLAEAIQ